MLCGTHKGGAGLRVLPRGPNVRNGIDGAQHREQRHTDGQKGTAAQVVAPCDGPDAHAARAQVEEGGPAKEDGRAGE
eukprot:scaffold263_cov120-Isochrysis_galbana.AAC.21